MHALPHSRSRHGLCQTKSLQSRAQLPVASLAGIVVAVTIYTGIVSTASASFVPSPMAAYSLALLTQKDLPNVSRCHAWNLCVSRIPRGGSSKEDVEDDEDGEEAEDVDDDAEDDVEEVSTEYANALPVVDSDAVEVDDEETEIDGVQIELNVDTFDEPWVISSFSNLYASLGVMLLARKIDLFHPVVVRIARIAYVAFLVLQQLFLFYVRIQAKVNNDRTPLQLTNPLSSLIQGQLANATGGGMIKDLASSFLSSSSTVLEYDIKQALSMQSGLIFNMLFMWFLHFKMNQVQPLIIQTVNGLQSLIYSPLFQIYVMGRNLKRPFENTTKARDDTDLEVPADEDVIDSAGDGDGDVEDLDVNTDISQSVDEEDDVSAGNDAMTTSSIESDNDDDDE